ncbi:methyl-accepting chemotaxis protein [Pelobacter propionicus]|uniref:Methyl-accepting chemotaxis sensory transducer n=1 Tax=Pelobacter propionicus (strain DSM 2379 / NBRC 103807 / OttBd1) TaxID=338966 RepID=A1AK12_PELPD|nr:methyl-accepting chemotaxis protein [Pelobacter propionicus]ABK97682.1 methyl-accepting chemotaxis sensory transducer [Pelobacter propionicus DSM 2379]
MAVSGKGLGFGNKILLMVLVCSIGLASLTSLIALREYVGSYTRFIDMYRASLFSDFDSQARSEVDTAVSMLQAVYERQQKGELSPEQARKLGADLLRELRYGKEGYFWADTTEGINVVLLGKPSEGTSRIDLQDKKGTYMIRELIEKGKQPGGGFTDYWFPKQGETAPSPKRGYSLEFKPFGWVIGTGNYVDDLEGLVAKAAEESKKNLRQGIYLIVGVTLVLAVIIAFVSLMVTRRLLRHIGTEPVQLEEITRQVAEGDLTYRFEQGKGGVYEAMRQMVEQLRQVMDKVNRSSQDVASASVELNSSADQMASASHEVVSQANTVATASEEMSATSMDIANNCHRAAESSNQASRTAQAGADIVRSTVDGMSRIAEKVRGSATVVEQLGVRSDQIGEIVATIQDIADQTNLLALNAAIEAARAGEQGRGFAVVADEVRALAERTTRATREIGEMIKNIQNETRCAVSSMEEGVQEVEQGTVEAARSGQALEEILEKINEVTTQISQIATAAEEQTATTREISNNIQQISEVVDMTAKGAQDISQSSSSLSQLSVDLQDLVRRFQV